MGEEEILSLRFVADDSSVLDSVDRVEEKITNLNEQSKTLFNAGEGQANQITNPFAQKISGWASELDNILRARKQIDNAMNDVDRQDATAKYERKIEVANKTIDDLVKSKALTDGLLDQFGSAFTDGLNGIVGKLSLGMRKVALNLASKHGPVSDDAIIKEFQASNDYRIATAELKKQDRTLFKNDNIAQYLRSRMAIDVPQYTRSEIVGGSNVVYRDTPKTFRELLPKSFQAIPAYRPSTVGKAGSTEASKIPLTKEEAISLRDIIHRDRYAADAAVAAGLFTKRGGNYIYNPDSTREMVNIMGGYTMDDITRGAGGEKKYGIRNVEDESNFRNILRKVGNNQSLDHGLFSARALNDRFEWLNPIYLEGERYNPQPGEGVFAGKIKHGPRRTSKAFAEYTLDMMEQGVEVSGDHPVAIDKNGNWVQLPTITRPTSRDKSGIGRAITPDDWHTISLSNSLLQEMVESTPSASKVGHNDFSDNMIYLKYDDKLSDPTLTEKEREQYIQRYAAVFKNGYRANGVDYINTRIGKTHAEFMKKDVVADLGRQALNLGSNAETTDAIIQAGLNVLANGGGLGHFDNFKPFAKSLYNQNLLATEGENLKDWLGTQFGFSADGTPNMKVVVGRFGEKDMDGANLINSIISSEGFQGRSYGGKATYVPIKMSGYRRLNYKQIEGNEETERRIKALDASITGAERDSRIAQIMDQYGGDLIIPGAGIFGDDLRVGKDVDVVEDYNNIKNKELLEGLTTQEQVNARRSKDYSERGITAKTTYDAAGTSSRWLSKQLINSSMNAGFRDPEVSKYFDKIFFDEIAKLDDDQYVRDLLFNGDQKANLNSPESRQKIQNHINGMWEQYSEGDRLLPTGVYSYAMAAPNPQSVINNALKRAGVELTDEQKALELNTNDVISLKSLEEQLGIVRFPATKGGNISAANLANDEKIGDKVRKLASQLGMDPKGLYFKPDSQILKLLQGEDFDGDINGLFGLTGKSDPEFSRIMQRVAEIGQQEYERIQTIASQASPESRKGGVVTKADKKGGYQITNAEDRARYLVQGQRDSALMGMAERSADMSALLGAGMVDPTVAQAILDYEKMYDTVSTHMKTAEEWRLTDEQKRASQYGRSFSNIFKYANDALQTFGENDSSEQRWTKDSDAYFAEKNIDQLNLPSIFQGSVIGTLIARMKETKRGGSPNGIGRMGEQVTPWENIFAGLNDNAPIDTSTESGKLSAMLRGMKKDILTSKYLISSSEDVAALDAQAAKARQEIMTQVSGYSDPLEQALKERELREKAGLGIYENFKMFGLTEENYNKSDWIKNLVENAAKELNVPVSSFFSKAPTQNKQEQPIEQPVQPTEAVSNQKQDEARAQLIQRPNNANDQQVVVTTGSQVPPIRQTPETAQDEARRLLRDAGVKNNNAIESLLNLPETQLQDIINNKDEESLLKIKGIGKTYAPKIIQALTGSRISQIKTTPPGPERSTVGSVGIPQIQEEPETAVDRLVECPVCGTTYPESEGSCPNSGNHDKIKQAQRKTNTLYNEKRKELEQLRHKASPLFLGSDIGPVSQNDLDFAKQTLDYYKTPAGKAEIEKSGINNKDGSPKSYENYIKELNSSYNALVEYQKKYNEFNQQFGSQAKNNQDKNSGVSAGPMPPQNQPPYGPAVPPVPPQTPPSSVPPVPPQTPPPSIPPIPPNGNNPTNGDPYQAFLANIAQGAYKELFEGSSEFSKRLYGDYLLSEKKYEGVPKSLIALDKNTGIAKSYERRIKDFQKTDAYNFLTSEQQEQLDRLISPETGLVALAGKDFSSMSKYSSGELLKSITQTADKAGSSYDPQIAALNQWDEKIKEVAADQQKLLEMSKDSKYSDTLKDKFKEDAAEIGKNLDQINKKRDTLKDTLTSQNTKKYNDQITALEDQYGWGNRYQKASEKAKRNISSVRENLQKSHANGLISDEDFKANSERLKALEAEASAPAMALRTGITKISNSLSRISMRFGRQMFYKALAEAKKFVKEFNSTMTEIQMITLKTDDQMSNLGSNLIEKAKELKISVSEVTKSAATLYRQGLSDQEVSERLDVVSKFSKVSGTKVEDATKLITVAMNTGLVSNAVEAADIVTALGDNAATNAAQIEKGIEKAGAAAAADGTTFGQLAAMLTAITSTTQIGGNVAGRTLNTIFGRMNKIGTNELIYDENGNAVSGSAVAKLLEAQGIRMYDENGNKRSSFDTLYALSQKWEGMSDAEQQQIANAIAGTRQYSNFAAIMQGMSEGEIDKYMDLIGESSGITDKKFDVYTKSLDASLTNLRNTFDALIADLTSSGALTGIIDQITAMIQGVDNLTGSLGNLSGLLPTILAFFGAIQGMKIGGMFGPWGMAIGGILGGLGLPAAFSGLVGAGQVDNRSATKIYEDKVSTVKELSSQRTADLTRFKELSKKGSLSKDEKTEFDKLAKDLGSVAGVSAETINLATNADKAASAISSLSDATTKLSAESKSAADQIAKEAEIKLNQRNVEETYGMIDAAGKSIASQANKAVDEYNKTEGGAYWFQNKLATFAKSVGIEDFDINNTKSIDSVLSKASIMAAGNDAEAVNLLNWVAEYMANASNNDAYIGTEFANKDKQYWLKRLYDIESEEGAFGQRVGILGKGALSSDFIQEVIRYGQRQSSSSTKSGADVQRDAIIANTESFLRDLPAGVEERYVKGIATDITNQYYNDERIQKLKEENGGVLPAVQEAVLNEIIDNVLGRSDNTEFNPEIFKANKKASAIRGGYKEGQVDRLEELKLENPGETGYFFDENKGEFVSVENAMKQQETYNTAIKTATKGVQIQDKENPSVNLGTYWASDAGSLEKAQALARDQKRFYYTDQDGNRIYTDRFGNFLISQEQADMAAGYYNMEENGTWQGKYHDYTTGEDVVITGTREGVREQIKEAREQSKSHAFGVSAVQYDETGMPLPAEDLTGYTMSQEEAEAFVRQYNQDEQIRYAREMAAAEQAQLAGIVSSYKNIYGETVEARGATSKAKLEEQRLQEIKDNYYVLKDQEGKILKTFAEGTSQEELDSALFDLTDFYLNNGSGEFLGRGQAGVDAYKAWQENNKQYYANGQEIGIGAEGREMVDYYNQHRFKYKRADGSIVEGFATREAAEEAQKLEQAELQRQMQGRYDWLNNDFLSAYNWVKPKGTLDENGRYSDIWEGVNQEYRTRIENLGEAVFEDMPEITDEIIDPGTYKDVKGFYDFADKIVTTVKDVIPELANVDPARIAQVYGQLPSEVQMVIKKIAETGEATLEEVEQVQEAVEKIPKPKLKPIYNRFNGSAAAGYSAWTSDAKNANALVADRIIRDIQNGNVDLTGPNALQNLVDFINTSDNLDWESLSRALPEFGRMATQVQLDSSGRVIGSPKYALENLLSILYGAGRDYGEYAFTTSQKGEMAQNAFSLLSSGSAVSYEDAISRVDKSYKEQYQNPYEAYVESLPQLMAQEAKEQAIASWKKRNNYVSLDEYRKQSLKDIPYFTEIEEKYLREAVGDDLVNRLKQNPESVSDAEKQYANMLLENYSLGRTDLTAEQRLTGLRTIRGMSAQEYKEFAESDVGKKAVSQFAKGLSNYNEYNALRKKQAEGKELSEDEQTTLNTLNAQLDQIEKNAEIEVKIENIKALEQAGEVAEGTASAFEKLALGGKAAAEALNELTVKGFESGQRRAKLYNGTARQQDEAAMAYLGMSADQYYADREGNLQAAKDYETILRASDARQWEELLAGAPTEEERQRIIDIAKRAGFEAHQDVVAEYGPNGLQSRYDTRFSYAGAGNVANVNPLIGKEQAYTDYELAQARQAILNGTLTDKTDLELYNAAVQSGGHYFQEYERRLANGDIEGANKIKVQARQETALAGREARQADQLEQARLASGTLGGMFAYAQEQQTQSNKAKLAADQIFGTLDPSKIKSFTDLANSVNGDQAKNWRDLLESTPELAQKLTDLGATVGPDGIDFSDVESSGRSLADALSMLTASVAEASKSFGQYKEVLTTGETYDRAMQYLSGAEVVDEAKGFEALNQVYGNQALAQVVANNRATGALAEGEWIDNRGLVRDANGDIVNKSYDKYATLSKYNREYAETLEQNAALGISGLTDVQRLDQLQTIMNAAQNGGLAALREDDKINQFGDVTSGIEGFGQWEAAVESIQAAGLSLKDYTKDSEAFKTAIEASGMSVGQFDSVNKQMTAEIRARSISAMKLYGENSDEVANFVRSIAKGGKDASQAIGQFNQKVAQLNNGALAIQKAAGKKGSQVDAKTRGDIAAITGDDADLMKNYTKEQMEEALNRAQDIIDDDYVNDLGAKITEKLNAAFSDKEITADLAVKFDVNADGELDLSEIEALARELGDEALAILASHAGTIGQLLVEIEKNGMSETAVAKVIKGSVNAGGTGKRMGGGGGGGGGKSPTDKLLEQQKHRISDINHQIKMTQIDEAHQDRMNNTSAYFDSLDREIGLQNRLGKEYQNNIAEMKAQLGSVKEGSDDWKKLTEAIWEAEEAYAAIQDTIEDVNAKRLAHLQKQQKNQDAKDDYTTSMWGIYAQRFLSEERYADYRQAIENQIGATRSAITTNNQQITELEGELGNFVEGSDEFMQIEQDIMNIKQDTAQKENEMVQLQIELDRQRLAQIATYLQRSSATSQHNINMLQTYGQAYSTAGFNDEYRKNMEDQLDDYDKLIAANREARDSAVATMNSFVTGSTVWYEARDAVYQYDEAIAQATTAQIELRRAMQELDLQMISDAYNDAIRGDEHVTKLMEDLRQSFLETKDYEAYNEATRRIIDEKQELIDDAQKAAQAQRDYIANNELDIALRREAEETLNQYEETVSSLIAERDRMVRELQKNEIDQMIEKMDWRASEYEHNLKLIQYQETKYQNADELTNYGIMLQHETDLRQENADALEEEITALKAELVGLEENKEEYQKVVEQIRKKEEQLKSENTQILKNNELLEENTKKIVQVRKTLEDSIDKEIRAEKKRQRDMLNATVSMQNNIVDVIRKRYTAEFELEKRRIDQQKKNLAEEKALISQRLNARKKAADEAEKYEELAELRRQLALIQSDTTRTKDAKELREKIKNLEKDIAWNIADQEAAAEQEGLDNQIKALDDYVTVNEENLNEMLSDANNFVDEVGGLVTGSYEQIVLWMQQNNTAYKNSLDEAQQQMINSWEDTWKAMHNITDTYWTEVGQLMVTRDTYLDYMRSTSQEYRDANESGRFLLEKQWEDMYDKYVSSTVTSDEAVNWQIHQHDLPEIISQVDKLNDIVYDIYGIIKDPYEFEKWRTYDFANRDNSTGEMPDFSVDYTGWGRTEDLSGTDSYEPSDYSGDGGGSGGGGGSGSSGQKTPKRYKAILTYIGGKGSNPGATRSYEGYGYPAEMAVAVAESSNIYGGTLKDKKIIPEYLHGGLVDYTGTAWVDGTKKRPEAFLDAYDTESIRQMLDAFNYIRQKPMMTAIDPAFFKSGTTNTMGDLNVSINVEKLDSDADYEYIADRVGEVFQKKLQKNGFNTAAYSF